VTTKPNQSDLTAKAAKRWQEVMMSRYKKCSPGEKARLDALAAEVFAGHPEWQKLMEERDG
jgi:hypothetical protein